MQCKLCGGKSIDITYNGLIRDGGLNHYTTKPVSMYRCKDCGVIWHEKMKDVKEYYESKEYRNALEGSSEEEYFYLLHDKDTLDKLFYTGTDVFRHKTVADIGCGCGAFLDFVSGPADEVIGIEPSETYREIMTKKGFRTYAYAAECIKDFTSKVDVITSFDVIEHVEDPTAFMEDVYQLLSDDGRAIIGTPTETPVMRELLGEIYERKLLFSTQHIWVLSEDSLRYISEKAGFTKVEFKYYQRYGLENVFGWLRDKEPRSDIKNSSITETMDQVWKSECSASKMADYIVVSLQK